MEIIQSDLKDPSILSRFISFIRKPEIEVRKGPFNFHSVIQCIYLYLSVFIVGILLISPLFALIQVDKIPHQVENFIQQFPMWQAIIIVVILGPAMEEIIFRLPLKYPLSGFILIQVMAVVWVYYLLDNAGLYFWWNIGITAIISSTLYLSVRRYIFKRQLLYNQYHRFFPIAFYSIAIFFALAHLFNFDGDFVRWYFIPVLIFPQFLLALVLGFLRLRFGMWACILIHSLNNFWPILMLYAGGSGNFPTG